MTALGGAVTVPDQFVRRTDAGIETGTVTLVRDDRTVTLGGVVHIAASGYWAAWRRRILDALDAGMHVQTELVRSKGRTGRTSLARAYGAVTMPVLKRCGLTAQFAVLGDLLPRIEVTDMTIEEMRDRLGVGETRLITALSMLSVPLVAVAATWRRDMLIARLTGADESPLPERFRQVILHDRNAVAVDAIDNAEHDRLLALWGAAHLPGIVSGLQDRGWSVVGLDWTIAFATLPSDGGRARLRGSVDRAARS